MLHFTNNTLHWHLKNIGRFKLLKPEQEIDFGKQVQDMISVQAAENTLARQLKREPTLAEWLQHCQLSQTEMQEILDRGKRAKQTMIEANLRLVVKIAKDYQNRGLELQDLIQEGSLGLQRGIEKFDFQKGYRLSTYCCHWIRQRICYAIATSSRTIKTSIYVTEKLNLIKKVRRQLSQQLGRLPTCSEIAEISGLNCEKVAFYLEAVRQPVSLNLNVEDCTELGDLIEDATWEREQEKIALALDLEILMGILLPQQQKVLSLKYGLESGKPLTSDEISKILNRSKQRVYQIEKQALERMRSYLSFKQNIKYQKHA